jgi:hypothetical protein
VRISGKLGSLDPSRRQGEWGSSIYEEGLMVAQRLAEMENDPNLARKQLQADYNAKHRRRGRKHRGQD